MTPSTAVPRLRIVPLAAFAIAALIALAGCGSSNKSSDNGSASSSSSSSPAASTATTDTSGSSSSAGSAQTLQLTADAGGALKFNTTSLTAKAGKVTVEMKNPSSLPHGIAVEGNGVDKDGQTVNQNGTSTVTVTLKPGKYQFYCPVPGHKAAGMKGTLTVS